MKSVRVGIGITVLVVLICVILIFLLATGRLGCCSCSACNRKLTQVIDTLPSRLNRSQSQIQVPQNTSNTLSILSYNVFLRPHLVQNDAQCSRASLIPFSIVNHFSRLPGAVPDVICFQECFSKRATDHLVKALRRAGWPHVTHSPKSGATATLAVVGSGLLVASKFPFVGASRCVPFAACEGTDCLAEKGFMHVTLEHPRLGQVHVINTHLQLSDAILPPDAPQSGKQWERLRRRRRIQLQQLQHIYDYVSTATSIPTTDVVIYSGDWNIDLLRSNNYNNQFGLVMSALHALQPIVINVDSVVPIDGTRNGFVGRAGEAEHNGCLEEYVSSGKCACCPKRWVDYVVCSAVHKTPCTSSLEVIQLESSIPYNPAFINRTVHTQLSDHYPVLGTLLFA